MQRSSSVPSARPYPTVSLRKVYQQPGTWDAAIYKQKGSSAPTANSSASPPLPPASYAPAASSCRSSTPRRPTRSSGTSRGRPHLSRAPSRRLNRPRAQPAARNKCASGAGDGWVLPQRNRVSRFRYASSRGSSMPSDNVFLVRQYGT